MTDGDPLAKSERLAALARVLPATRTHREAMDRLAGLAATVMDAPIGLITLLSQDTQYLVGLSGMSLTDGQREQPVERSYCAETLRSGDTLLLDDAAADPEFAEHPAHRELGLVAYAGAPLREHGQLIGTVCVLDTRPRRWRHSDRLVLEALAESVVSETALHRDVDRRRRLLDAFDHAPAAIAVTRGCDHTIDYTNAAYRDVFGPVPHDVPGRKALPDLSAEFFDLMDQVLATGEVYAASGASVTMTWPGESTPRERFFDFSYSAVDRTVGGAPRGLLVVAVEVTGRVLAARAAERRARHNELLARTNSALNRHLDPTVELQALADAAVPELADVSTVHRLTHPVPPGTPPPLPVITDRVAVAVGAPGLPRPPVQTRVRWEDPDDPVCAAIARGAMLTRPIPTPEVPTWARSTGTADTFSAGLDHVVLAPVIVEGLVVAVVGFGLTTGRALWDDTELALLADVTHQAAHALDHALSYERARSSTLVLQRSLLSAPPHVDGLDICARYRPAGRDEVGGDWYDVFPRRPDQLAVVVGDVLGHDITAAAAMGQLRAGLRTIALDRSGGPGAALDRLDTINARLRITPLATAVHAHLTRTPTGWTLRWANAGHPPPLLVVPGRAPRFLERHGAALTLVADAAARPETELDLPPGATLLLYTDGLVEQPGVDIDDGLARLARHAPRVLDEDIDQVCDDLLDQAPDDDDVALLALRVVDAPG